jgi:hypothetical protein
MLRSILYMSNSELVYSSEQQTRIDELVAQSRSWNHSVGITGALVFTERNFVQFIEGPENAIIELFANIQQDRRHSRINVIEDIGTDQRHFEGWSLAYSGPDAFIDYDLAPLLKLHAGTGYQDLGVRLRTRLRAMANV